MSEKDRLNQITETVIGAAIKVHRTLGNVNVLTKGIVRVVNNFPDSE